MKEKINFLSDGVERILWGLDKFADPTESYQGSEQVVFRDFLQSEFSGMDSEESQKYVHEIATLAGDWP